MSHIRFGFEFLLYIRNKSLCTEAINHSGSSEMSYKMSHQEIQNPSRWQKNLKSLENVRKPLGLEALCQSKKASDIHTMLE